MMRMLQFGCFTVTAMSALACFAYVLKDTAPANLLSAVLIASVLGMIVTFISAIDD